MAARTGPGSALRERTDPGRDRLGAEIRGRRNSAAGRSLSASLSTIRTEYTDSILPITGDVAETWGRLGTRRPLPVVDGLLAATALVHRLTLVTRDVHDFEGLCMRLLDPRH